jgi:3-methyladenine DNA glycosylase/8-oxoguanine DNA glycosylase
MPTRLLPSSQSIDLPRTLGPLRRGIGDPTMRVTQTEVWRATRTADGPATMRLTLRTAGVEAEAWGPGAEWAIEHAPAIVGAQDDWSDFEPNLLLLRDLRRRFPGIRLSSTGAVMEALMPAVIEQKVTGTEAWRAWRGIIRAYSEPAPGPAGLRLPPSPALLAALPYYTFHPLGVERRRAETLRRACARAVELERIVDLDHDAARTRLMAIPGVGPWTAAEVAVRALGDPDAVSVGDFHLPNLISWALAGEPRGDDARMLELLEPYRGHRARVIRLLEASGLRPPRYGPRLAPRSIDRI